MGCATMSLSFSLPDAAMTAYIQGQGSMSCSFDQGEMDCSYDKGEMEADLGERGSMTGTLNARAQMILSLICTTDLHVITVLCANDGIPVLTLDGEYLILRE